MARNYASTTWVDGVSPGISGAQLNRIDSGVETLYQEFDDLVGALFPTPPPPHRLRNG